MRVCVALSLSLLLVGLCSAQTSHAAIRKDLNVPPEDLSPALQQVATTYEIQLLYPTPLTKDLKTHGAVGSLTADDALTKVLSGTGLSYKYLDANTVTVFATAAPAAAAQDQTNQTRDKSQEAGKSSSHDFRVAQVDQAPAGNQAVEQKEDKKNKEAYLQEVVVTGSRIPTAAGQLTVPVRSYTREDIQNSGQTTLGDFLNTLPDVSTITNSGVQTGLAGTQSVQLHGLPLGTTLTLLDGQRIETSTLGFFDLSNIPISAVERIEILPVGASAVYGSDALAGAVNFILRRDFEGFEVNATLDHAPGVNNPGVDLAWGTNWGNRGAVSLIASYQEFGELLGTQREPTSLTQFPVNLPQSTELALGSDTCDPGNVYSVDGSNLPGLSSPEAGIPAGLSGKPTIGQFAATAGKLNVCNAGRYSDITPWSAREGVLLMAHYEFSEYADLFTEVLASHRDVRNQVQAQLTAYSYYNGTVPANNPYNPFGEAVNVSFVYPGAGVQETNSASFTRPMVGVRGSLFTNWHYEATTTFSRDQLHDVNSLTDFGAISTALASSNPATALNPFTSGPPGTPQLLSSLIGPSAVSRLDEQLVTGQGILRGPLLELPAGPLQTVLGGEIDQERENTSVTYGPVGLESLHLHRNSYATFGEARIPLFASGAPPQRDERLSLTLAGRYDHSDDFGGKATGQGALLWRPLDSFSVTGGYGTSYEAPQLDQISGPQTAMVGPLFVTDPFRGNEIEGYNTTAVTGPNYNLKPETGDTASLRIAYATEARTGLRASLTWYDLKISNYIGQPSPQTLVDYPNLFPGAVVRAPPTPQDQQLGYLGVITQLNQTYYNFGDIHVEGVDADMSYAFDTRLGEFTPSLAIANIYKWQAALTPNAPIIDGVSEATIYSVGWSPRWKGTAALAWKRGPLSVTIDGRYIGRYLDYQETIPNDSEIGNTWIFDVSARAEFGQAISGAAPWLRSAYVAIGAVNVFNEIPPFSLNSSWYDIQEYDIRGRYLHLSFGMRL